MHSIHRSYSWIVHLHRIVEFHLLRALANFSLLANLNCAQIYFYTHHITELIILKNCIILFNNNNIIINNKHKGYKNKNKNKGEHLNKQTNKTSLKSTFIQTTRRVEGGRINLNKLHRISMISFVIFPWQLDEVLC